MKRARSVTEQDPPTTSRVDGVRTAQQCDRGAGETDRASGLSDPWVNVQQTVGNQGVQRWATDSKLTMGGVDDRREREADRVAERVLRAPASAAETTVDPTGSTERPSGVDPVTAQRIRSLQGGGRPLRGSVRSFFEPRFDSDLGGVRVHTGPSADEAARAVDARAFTVGRDVVFRAGAYRPDTRSGTRLLAHELTHVVQSEHGDVVRRTPDGNSGTTKGGSQDSQPQFGPPALFGPQLPCGRPFEAYPIIEYIRGEMATNAKSADVKKIRQLNDYSAAECIRQWNKRGWVGKLLGPGLEECSKQEIHNRLTALGLWTIKLRTGGPWDHKPYIRKHFARPGLSTQVYHQLYKWGYFYDIWSNIHYGYVGAAAGFSKDTLLDGAGLEQIGTDILSGRWPSRKGSSGMRSFDDPSDRTSVEMGYDFYPGVPSTSAIAASVLATPGLSRKLAECCKQNPSQC